jgi:hypothetical protein
MFRGHLMARKILFSLFNGTTGTTGTATANADGSNFQQLTDSPTFDHQADWGVQPAVP